MAPPAPLAGLLRPPPSLVTVRAAPPLTGLLLVPPSLVTTTVLLPLAGLLLIPPSLVLVTTPPPGLAGTGCTELGEDLPFPPAAAAPGVGEEERGEEEGTKAFLKSSAAACAPACAEAKVPEAETRRDGVWAGLGLWDLERPGPPCVVGPGAVTGEAAMAACSTSLASEPLHQWRENSEVEDEKAGFAWGLKQLVVKSPALHASSYPPMRPWALAH